MVVLADPKVIKLLSPQNGDHGTGDLKHALTEHQTYGAEGGDISVMLYGVGFHFYITKDGRIFQGWDTDNICWHCNGSNFRAMGLEFESLTGEGLTDQQIEAGAYLHKLLEAEGLSLTFVDPDSGTANIRVNQTSFVGCISHKNVMTDDGSSQHTDHITVDEWNRMMALAGNPAADPQPNPTSFQLQEIPIMQRSTFVNGNLDTFTVKENGELWWQHTTATGSTDFRLTVNAHKTDRDIDIFPSVYGPVILCRGTDDPKDGTPRTIRTMVKGYIYVSEFI